MTVGIKYKQLPDSVICGELLSGHTSLRLGGPADYFALPESMEDFISATGWARGKNLPVMVIGGGSNLLFKDSGYRGLVVNLTRMDRNISMAPQTPEGKILLDVPAGVRLPALCSHAAREGLSGLLFASGIPGTVGGALFMNAGTHGGSMGDILESITAVLPDGRVETLGKNRLRPTYRRMEIKNAPCSMEDMIFTGCTLSLVRGDSKSLKEENRRLLARRKATQPLGTFNAGSFFKNPEGARSAGALIDSAGLKGFSIGGAEVSGKHANFLVNTGNATSRDMLELMNHIRSVVAEKFKIRLEPEVKVIG